MRAFKSAFGPVASIQLMTTVISGALSRHSAIFSAAIAKVKDARLEKIRTTDPSILSIENKA
ncbi:hypothetical protein [Rhizobium leguminosarum]|uniref:hypothetical protein n=1 Tax=Rhizobium leguminosarum TaxID=384 RepID=UPI001C93EE09|nr:hypothetical protein [Rhizobium leguminosarum]